MHSEAEQRLSYLKHIKEMNIGLFSQALEAYKYVCDNHITVYDKEGNAYPTLCYTVPSYRHSKVGWKYVHLRNGNGDIARYTIKTGEITV